MSLGRRGRVLSFVFLPVVALSEKLATLLTACAQPALYRRNGFRQLGLNAPAEPRGISRRFDELCVNLELGADLGEWAFAPNPAPDREELRSAVRRLQEPMGRLLDEFFWFWPLDYPEPAADDALKLIARGDTNGAAVLWSAAAGEGNPVAWHNLAVYQHLLALEWESDAGTDPSALRQLWSEAADYWQHVLADDAFWPLVATRIQQLQDPQLPPDAVAKLREALPDILARIHAATACRHAAHDEPECTLFHVGLVQSFLAREAATAVLASAAEPAVRRLETHVSQANREASSQPSAGLRVVHTLLESTNSDLALLDALGESAAALRRDHGRRITDAALEAIVSYQRATGDDAQCIAPLLHLLDAAPVPELAERVGQSFSVILGNALSTARAAESAARSDGAGLPEPALAVSIIESAVVSGLASLPLTQAGRESAYARLAGWLQSLAEQALRGSLANLPWAVHVLDRALSLAADEASQQVLTATRAAWLASPPATDVAPLQITAGGRTLIVDNRGIALDDRWVPVEELTGIRHALPCFTADPVSVIGWSSAEEAFELDETFLFAEDVSSADPAAEILAAIHFFLIPALESRLAAAVESGSDFPIGETQLRRGGIAFPATAGSLIPYDRLLVAGEARAVTLTADYQSSLTTTLDPALEWNAPLLPHLLAHLASR